MAKPPILDPNRSYTFRSYFELPYETEDILAALGFSFSRTQLTLPQTARSLQRLDNLRQDIEATLPLVSLSNEAARREILIAPILTRVARDCHCQLRIEYPLTVSDRLKGNLDYWLRGQQQCVVIEAKNDDLTRGFTQLAVELIALAEWTDASSTLYGAVTIGDLWIFGTLDPHQAQIVQDINRYKIPGDLETLISILVGILDGDRPDETTQSAVL